MPALTFTVGKDSKSYFTELWLRTSALIQTDIHCYSKKPKTNRVWECHLVVSNFCVIHTYFACSFQTSIFTQGGEREGIYLNLYWNHNICQNYNYTHAYPLRTRGEILALLKSMKKTHVNFTRGRNTLSAKSHWNQQGNLKHTRFSMYVTIKGFNIFSFNCFSKLAFKKIASFYGQAEKEHLLEANKLLDLQKQGVEQKTTGKLKL